MPYLEGEGDEVGSSLFRSIVNDESVFGLWTERNPDNEVDVSLGKLGQRHEGLAGKVRHQSWIKQIMQK